MENKIIEISEQVSGDKFNLNLIKLQGICEGQTVLIQANVHGAEVQGNAVIFSLLDSLKDNTDIIAGQIHLIPQANPLGGNHKVGTYTGGRFNSVTGDNWNRLYRDIFSDHSLLDDFCQKNKDKSDEEIASLFKELLYFEIEKQLTEKTLYGPNENILLNLTLQQMASRASIVLDLHTGPIACDYTYAPEYLKKSVLDLNFPFNLIIPNSFGHAMDEASFMPWIHLKEALRKSGRNFTIPFESYTLELGSEERIDLQKAKEQASNICEYLVKRKVLKKNPFSFSKNKQYSCLLKDYQTYYAPMGGLYEYNKSPGDFVKKGEILNTILNFNDLSSIKHTVHAKNDSIIINHNPSASLRSGMETYQVMENYWKEDGQ